MTFYGTRCVWQRAAEMLSFVNPIEKLKSFVIEMKHGIETENERVRERFIKPFEGGI